MCRGAGLEHTLAPRPWGGLEPPAPRPVVVVVGLQCIAMHCNAMAMQCTAIQCNTMQSMHLKAIQCAAMQCKAINLSCSNTLEPRYLSTLMFLMFQEYWVLEHI